MDKYLFKIDIVARNENLGAMTKKESISIENECRDPFKNMK